MNLICFPLLFTWLYLLWFEMIAALKTFTLTLLKVNCINDS